MQALSRPNFAVYEPISLSSIHPSNVLENSMYVVNIYGNNYQPTGDLCCRFRQTNVEIEKVYIVKCRFLSHKHIQCLQPDLFIGNYAVEVSNNGFNFSQDSRLSFSVYPAITLDYLEPNIGWCGGGTNITAWGTGFIENIDIFCRFGGAVVKAVFHSPTRISCLTPTYFLRTEQIVNFGVSINRKSFSDGGSLKFRYVASPIITKLHPSSGQSSGGTKVILGGEFFGTLGLGNDVSCRFESIIVEAEVLTDNEISCVTPNFSHIHSKNSVAIEVSIDGGQSYSKSNIGFMFESPSKTLSFSPSGGIENGGNLVKGMVLFSSIYLFFISRLIVHDLTSSWRRVSLVF